MGWHGPDLRRGDRTGVRPGDAVRCGPLYASNLLIAGLLATGVAAIFPVVLHSTLAPENSLTAYDVAAGPNSLAYAVIWWPIGFALTVAYFVFVSRQYAREKSASSTTTKDFTNRKHATFASEPTHVHADPGRSTRNPAATACPSSPRHGSAKASAPPIPLAGWAVSPGRVGDFPRLPLVVLPPDALDHRGRLCGGPHRQRRPADGLRPHRYTSWWRKTTA